MAIKQTTREGGSRGILQIALARPLDTLVFLAPLILCYEAVFWQARERLVAYDIIYTFLRLFGHVGTWVPPLAVIVILLATHVASGQPWKVHWRSVLLMYLEAAALAVPLLFLNRSVRLAALLPDAPRWLREVGLSIGAGVYEEMVFRLIFITLTVVIGVDILRIPRRFVVAAAVILSTLTFAAYHHPPLGGEPFVWQRFLFRCIAGLYLAGIFWYRGYGPAVGAHSAYNVAVIALLR